jgi:Uma2 family endonuclease
MIRQLTDPQPRRWTKDEYHRLADLGFFDGQKVELLEGELVVSSPQNWPHAVTVDRSAEVLRQAFGSGYWVRSQLPLDLGQVSEPEADVSVVPGRREDYSAHPTTADLIVEVSDSTLASDRGQKGSLYARARIQDYWIINLIDHQLEVYRNPVPDASQVYGHRYADRLILKKGDVVRPLAAPHVQIAVADLLG